MFHLSISCWSECPADFSGPASADGSSDLLTILYHKYIQPHSPRLRKTKSRSSNSKFQLPVLKAVFILFLQWPSSSQLFCMDPSSQAGEMTLSEGQILFVTSEFNSLVSTLFFSTGPTTNKLMQVLHEDLEN